MVFRKIEQLRSKPKRFERAQNHVCIPPIADIEKVNKIARVLTASARTIAGVAFAAALVAGCSPSDNGKETAVKVADSYIQKEHKIRTEGLSRSVYDDGDSWIISYKPPPDTMGGSALVQIHKESKSVVAVSLGQ
jgi:hypothetical protein